MPNREAIREDDIALLEMFRHDNAGTISKEDEETYRKLIRIQEKNHIATQVEVKDANTGETATVKVRSLGGAALENAMVVHSDSWITEDK